MNNQPKIVEELEAYMQKLKSDIRKIDEEIEAMEKSCATLSMERVWRNSKDYAELFERKVTLNDVCFHIAYLLSVSRKGE